MLLSNELPLNIHRYPSGSEFGTWVVPDQWDVKAASLSDGDRVIASIADHPLFLAPYSHSFEGWLSRDELLTHVKSDEERPDAYLYEYRLASDYQRRLKEWLIALPHSLVLKLDKLQYFVDIQVETTPGHMLVGEHTLKGRNDYTFALLTHLCHPGQANDGLAGVAVGIEVLKRLAKEFSLPNYNYQLLIMPETIGSSVYLAENGDQIDSYLGSVFIEMAGIRSPVSVKFTRRGNTYLDRVLRQVVEDRGIEFGEAAFREPWGNDELVFDSPGVGIPGAAIQRFPFPAYHTSGDNMAETDPSSLEEMVEILMETVRVIESDFIPAPKQRVPVYLTRFNLYADAQNDTTQYLLNASVLDALWSGKSVFDIAQQVGAPYSAVKDFLGKLVENDLLETNPMTPQYFRQSLDS